MKLELYNHIVDKYTDIVIEIENVTYQIKKDYIYRNGKYETHQKLKNGLKSLLSGETESTIKIIIEPQKEYIKSLVQRLKQLKNKSILYRKEFSCFLDDKGFVAKGKHENIEITKDNICLYYDFMVSQYFNYGNDKYLLEFSNVINEVLCDRFFALCRELSICPTILHLFSKYNYHNANFVTQKIFGISDLLKPLNEYKKEIMETEDYKSYISEKTSKQKTVA